MADVQLFKFDGLFAESTPEPRPRSTKPNKYEFGIAYGVPETIPLDGLREAISKGLKEDGRGLAKYPHPQGYPPLRELIAQRLLATRNVPPACSPSSPLPNIRTGTGAKSRPR